MCGNSFVQCKYLRPPHLKALVSYVKSRHHNLNNLLILAVKCLCLAQVSGNLASARYFGLPLGIGHAGRYYLVVAYPLQASLLFSLHWLLPNNTMSCHTITAPCSWVMHRRHRVAKSAVS